MPWRAALIEAHIAAGGGLDHSYWGDSGDRIGGLCCRACVLHSGTHAIYLSLHPCAQSPQCSITLVSMRPGGALTLSLQMQTGQLQPWV